jgi:hypothetical protein
VVVPARPASGGCAFCDRPGANTQHVCCAQTFLLLPPPLLLLPLHQVLTCQPLPDAEAEFFELLNLYFPNVFDMK